jgi:predicted SAM-dependent methyltransferase
MWVNPEKNVKGMKLDIGAGDPATGHEVQAKGFVLNDIEAYDGIDLVCNILDLPLYVNKEQCSVIRASHVLEHFTNKQVKEVLDIIHSLLEPKGKVEIIVPNLEWHAGLIIEGYHEDAIRYIFGGQQDQWDIHKTGFTANTLYDKVVAAGFNVDEVLNESSITLHAHK